MAGFPLLVPLAPTSTDRAIRGLGPMRRRRLHRLVSLAVPVGALRDLMLSKGWQGVPLAYLPLRVALRLMPIRLSRARRCPTAGPGGDSGNKSVENAV